MVSIETSKWKIISRAPGTIHKLCARYAKSFNRMSEFSYNQNENRNFSLDNFCMLTSALEEICTLRLVRTSDISLSLIALWEKKQFLYNKLLKRTTFQCLFNQVCQVFTWEKFCRQCFRQISLPELGQDPTNHPHLSVDDEKNYPMRENKKKSCAIANRAKKTNITMGPERFLQSIVHVFPILRLTRQKSLKDHIQSARDNKQSLCQVCEVSILHKRSPRIGLSQLPDQGLTGVTRPCGETKSLTVTRKT